MTNKEIKKEMKMKEFEDLFENMNEDEFSELFDNLKNSINKKFDIKSMIIGGLALALGVIIGKIL